MSPRWRVALLALAILALFSLSSAIDVRGDLALSPSEEDASFLSLSDSIGVTDSLLGPGKAPKPKAKASAKPKSKPKPTPKPKSSAAKAKSSQSKKSSSSASSKDVSSWAYAELKRLAGIVESGGRAGAQKLGWSAYDKDRKNIGSKNGYTYNSASGDHTEKQMVDDKTFKTAVAKAKYVLIWSTQAPCVFGAAHGSQSRQPCSIILPNYVKSQTKVNFFVGFSSRKFAQHEYIKMKNAGMGTTWADFQKKLQAMWKLPSANCRLLMWDGSADYKAGDWVKIALLEEEAHLMSEFHQHLAMHTLAPSSSSSKKSESSAGDVVPGHKIILQAVLHAGEDNKYKTAWQMGEEDGKLVGKVVNGSSFPTTWPKNVTYVAIWVSPFSASILPPIFKYATFAGNHQVKINVVYLTTDPPVTPVAQVIDKAAREAKWDGWNLRFFTLLGSNDVPNRLWPPKVDAVSESSSAQSSTGNMNAQAEEPARPKVGPYEVLPKS